MVVKVVRVSRVIRVIRGNSVLLLKNTVNFVCIVCGPQDIRGMLRQQSYLAEAREPDAPQCEAIATCWGETTAH
jgi:hypothetical protein